MNARQEWNGFYGKHGLLVCVTVDLMDGLIRKVVRSKDVNMTLAPIAQVL